MASKKVRGTALRMPAGIGVGAATALLLTVLLTAALTVAVLAKKIDEMYLGYFVMGILLIASFLGALISAKTIKRRRMLVCSITGGVFYLILLIGTAIFFGGNYQGAGVSGAMILLGSQASGALGLRSTGRRRKGYRKYSAC